MVKPLLVALFVFAFQDIPTNAQDTITESEKKEVVESIAKILRQDYIRPGKGLEISASLRAKLKTAEYQRIDDANVFAQKLTNEIQAISKDIHFFIGHDPHWVAAQNKVKDSSTLTQAEKARLMRINHGFQEVKILEGNIGYLNMTTFEDPQHSYKTATASLDFLSNTEAIIIDMRYNNGGHLEMAQLVASHFLKSDPPLALFDFYYTSDGKRIEQKYWVSPFVSAKRTPNKPLYILTSSTSFSCAEWFSYCLKNLGRATIVGERTAGGAHPVELKVVNSRFNMNVPVGEIKDLRTGKDFEGIGVRPDIKVDDEDALFVAHIEILKRLRSKSSDRREAFDWDLDLVQSRLRPVKLKRDALADMAGNYEGGRQIIIDDGELSIKWRGRHQVRLLPLTETLFAMQSAPTMRYRMVIENRKVTAIEQIFSDGNKRSFKKLN